MQWRRRNVQAGSSLPERKGLPGPASDRYRASMRRGKSSRDRVLLDGLTQAGKKSLATVVSGQSRQGRGNELRPGSTFVLNIILLFMYLLGQAMSLKPLGMLSCVATHETGVGAVGG